MTPALHGPALHGAVPIDAPFADVRGDALRWALGLPVRRALASRTVPLDGGLSVALQVLGASHQVLVCREGGVLLSETVACDLPDAAALPAHTAVPGYQFASVVDRLEPSVFASRVDALARELTEDPTAIVAAFPGNPYAVTAIALSPEPAALTWQTWHAYPQTGELVHTTTHLDAPEDAHG